MDKREGWDRFKSFSPLCLSGECMLCSQLHLKWLPPQPLQRDVRGVVSLKFKAKPSFSENFKAYQLLEVEFLFGGRENGTIRVNGCIDFSDFFTTYITL